MRARSRPAAFLVAAASGAAAGAAHLPGAWGALSWVAYAPLLWALDGAAPGEAFLRGLVFSSAMHLFAAPWLPELARQFLRAPWLVGAAVSCVFFAALNLRFALAAALSALAGSRARRAAAFVAACVALEHYWPTLFPSQLAWTQLWHLPTVQSAASLGSVSVAALIFSANAAEWLLAAEPGRRSAALAAAVVALALVNEAWGRRELARLDAAAAAAPSLRAAVVQAGSPNAPWLGAAAADESPAYAELTQKAAAEGALDLAVWPENSYGRPVRYGGAADALPVLLARGEGPAVLFNAVGAGADGRDRNVSVLAAPGGRILGVAEKRMLVPFGESLPPALAFLDRFIPARKSLVPGVEPELLRGLEPKARLGVAICYEDTARDMAAELAALGAQALVSQSNDSWFGAPFAEQHLLVSRLRAVENRRSVLHAGRTGVSAVVLPTGAVASRVELNERGFAAARIPLLAEAATGPRVGRWLSRCALALAAGLAAAGAGSRRTA